MKTDLKEKEPIWFRVFLTVWFGLFLALILNKGARVFPTGKFSIFSLVVALVVGYLVYLRVVLKIEKGEISLIGWKKWVVTKGGLIIYPAMIWLPINRGLPIIFDGSATAPHSEMVTIERKERHVVARRLNCSYEFRIKEFYDFTQGKLCIDQKTWENGKSGMKIYLKGRKNIMAYYVDKIELIPGF